MTSDEARDGVFVAGDERERADAFDVRHAVFVDEQGVPEELEWDDHDETATHFVAYDGGRPVGAARLREYERTDESRVGKVERVAVLDESRGHDWGRRLMDLLESTAAAEGYGRLVLHSQSHAAAFYRKLGYEQVGEEFVEADIPHVKMEKAL